MLLKLRGLHAPLLVAAALLSLVASWLRVPASWTLAGMGVLIPLLALAARWAAVRDAVVSCALGGAAVALWPVPLVWDRSTGLGAWWEAAEAAAFWALPALGAVGCGVFLRRQAAGRRRSIHDARREQQLQMARDLHDFVAHDVSAIVVQAQAARFVADSDPRQAARALERIEAAGLSALASMDRTVHALRDAGDGPTAPTPGLAELPELVARFEGGAVLEADPEASAALSRAAETTAYRVVVEALTNIRRHAPGTEAVRVTLRRTRAGLDLSVANGPAPRRGRALPPRRRHGGGTGLEGLRSRVEAADGTLTAGSDGVGGWRVSVVFPAAGPSQG
ncbi:histidine kinase [Streptomyces sp. NPDC048272]|uniref:sensor histidine kinase n=1 Tax=Streptomyces sp. NPDC048272 TaxID=3154616 RepID=UPI0033E63C34